MKITNKLGLPDPFIQAVSKEYQYKEKRYSVTTLLNSEREIILKRRHNDEIESDVADMIWAIFGTAVHSVLENSNKAENLVTEKYLSIPITLSDGDVYTLSGLCDLFDTDKGEVIDYKVTSTFKALKKDFEDYRMQGLMYCHMIRQTNFGTEENPKYYKPRRATFYMVLRDWQRSKAKFDKEYPQNQVQKVSFIFNNKDFEWIDRWLVDKFDKIKTAEMLADEDLPMCSEKDRWKNPDVWAVMKKGRKSALRLLNSEQDAEAYKASKGGDYVELRKGEDRKCKEYCSCCEFCPYYKKLYSNDSSGEMPF